MPGLAPLAVTMGDPAGVGPACTLEAYNRDALPGRVFYLIASAGLIDDLCGRGTTRARLVRISAPQEAEAAFLHGLPVLAVEGSGAAPGCPDLSTAAPTVESIRLAVEHVAGGYAAGIVTNPISKALLYQSGFSYPGHTEFLASLCPAPSPRVVMMLVGGGLKVALATIHTPLSSVPELLTQELIIETAQILDASLRRDFGLASPRIAVCGLNPHAGEAGALGREEIEIINPATAHLRRKGVDASDARPGDTVFHEALGGAFDAVLAMYHDQGLIPVKTLDLWGGVNVTLGLPFIRTSPDHGVAYPAAASGQIRPDSLMAALRMAHEMASRREAAL